jgi:hypothetical protein
MGFLKNMRNKSEAERTKLALVLAALVAVIILVFWLISLSGRFSESRQNTPEKAKPFQAITSLFSAGFSEVREENETRKSLFSRDRSSANDEEGSAYADFGDNLVGDIESLENTPSFQELLNQFDLPSPDSVETSGETDGETEVQTETQAETSSTAEQQDQGNGEVEVIEVQDGDEVQDE